MSPPKDDGPDTRVRDLIRRKELKPRRRLGERTLQRVGGRGWERPNVFVSAALFKRHGVRDPWDPAGGREDPIKLGPVSLRLGEKRRQPARHLRPKEPKSKKQADPLSKWRRPASSSQQTPRPAPRPAPAPAPRVAKRPAPPAPGRPKAGKAAENKDPDAFVPTPDRVERGMFRNKVKRGLKGPIPVRPDLNQPKTAPAPVVAGSNQNKAIGPEPVRPGRLPVRPSRPKNRAGRVSLRRQQATASLGGPEVVNEPATPTAETAPIAPLEVIEDGAPVPTKPAEPPKVNRKPPGLPMGLDDLFGGMSEGRVRMRRRASPPPESADGD